MTLRHLNIMIMVADLGSMTEAAKKLYISQPSVSQAIKELELHYDIKLFERYSKKLFITDVGKELLDYARHITKLYEEMERSIAQKSVLKIGASLTVGETVMPDLITNFKAISPHIEVQIVIKNTSELEIMLLSNEIDIALVEGQMHDLQIRTESVISDALFLVCGKSHKLFNKNQFEVSQLQQFNFIVREKGSGTRALLENVFKELNLQLNIAWECSSFESIKKAVIAGHGIAGISKRLIKTELEKGDLIILGEDLIKFKRSFSITYHRNKFITPAMINLIELIHKIS